jgi:NAD(P)-dependent dehydrogenase (short-subunit alcohol dehydrogenase family)
MKSIKELMNLSDRVALITGGAGHIGSEFADTLLECGAHVVIVDFNSDKLKAVKEKFNKTYPNKVSTYEVNLEDESQVRSLGPYIQKEFGHLEILINNAGFVGENKLEGWVVPFEEQSAITWRRAMEVNLTAPFELIQTLTPLMRKSKKGSIINIGSHYGVVGPDMRIYHETTMGNPAAYAASKGGLIQLTRWLSTVLAPDIRVNTITPGGVKRTQPENFQKEYVFRVPLQRMASEEDYKGALIYLASDLSRYMTGQNLIVDGGWTAW